MWTFDIFKWNSSFVFNVSKMFLNMGNGSESIFSQTFSNWSKSNPEKEGLKNKKTPLDHQRGE